MRYQTVFKRYEFKYMLTKAQKDRLLERMEPYMALDEFGKTTIRNVYFDTENYRLARHSIAKPVYKEKLRLRSYSQASPDSVVFVELKKKYRQVVYKRRISLRSEEAMRWVCGERLCPETTQISQEIDYFLDYYEALGPVVFLSYEREAYASKDHSDFRVTFDENILCRQKEVSLESGVYGTLLLPEGAALMEIKCSGGIPLWMTRTLSEEQIYKSSFSKYGTAYQTMIFPRLKEVSANV